MALLGGLDVRLDPWHVDYGSDPLAANAATDGSDQVGSCDVELQAETWRPVEPQAPALFRKLVFVDGVRRIEARILARRGDKLCHGAFGSYAVGSVGVQDGIAICEAVRVDRLIVLDSGETVPESIAAGAGLVYRPVSTKAKEPDAPLKRLQEEMRFAERRLSGSLSDQDGVLVISDGPLQFQERAKGSSVGFIKRVFELYLPASLLPVLFALPAGMRTPLFTLTSKGVSRYSWFVRLAVPARGESELSGIARLEVAEPVGVDAARRLADETTRVLPRFAPSRGRDPRAPQNLLPIGALESHLRHLLGDPNIVRRRIGDEIAREEVHA